jgi:ABC-type branched-subunit amino acid transport system permease subunit
MLASVLLYIVVCLGLNAVRYAGVAKAGAAFFGMCHRPYGMAAACWWCFRLMAATMGYYAALITIAFGILFRVFLEVNDTLGGPQGMKVPGMEILGWKLNDGLQFGDIELSFYANYVVLSLAMAAVAFMLVRRLERSWIGLSLDAVRLDETACAAFGINVARWKIAAFTLGNFLAGLAGSVYAMMTGFVAPKFTFGDSLILSIVILGDGNPWGLMTAIVLMPAIIQEYRCCCTRRW